MNAAANPISNVIEIETIAMNKRLINKTARTLARIKELRAELNACRESQLLLLEFKTGRKTLQGKDYSAAAINHKRTPEDEARFDWTIGQLKHRMALLECELSALLEYGA